MLQVYLGEILPWHGCLFHGQQHLFALFDPMEISQCSLCFLSECSDFRMTNTTLYISRTWRKTSNTFCSAIGFSVGIGAGNVDVDVLHIAVNLKNNKIGFIINII